jgi:hypothetical protein
MASIVDDILLARKWSHLGIPKTPKALRDARALCHPDVTSHPKATEAFLKLQELFDAPDIALRTASGYRFGNGTIEWKMQVGFEDLAEQAIRASNAVRALSDVDWVPTVTKSIEATGNTLISTYGDGWWLFSDFPTLDERTVAWVWGRMLAVFTYAATAGYVHGDITPEVVALHPAEHGLRLDGWWSSVPRNNKLVVRPTASTPPGFLAGNVATSAISVSQAASMLLDDPKVHIAKHLRAHLKEMSLRPKTSNFALLDCRQANEKDFGKRAWHPLAPPACDEI